MALENWRPYLHGRHFLVNTDNFACKWMLHHPNVSPKMARMLTFFSQFDFVLHHVKGRSNVLADALSRPTVSREKYGDSAVSTDHVPDTLHVVHECADACDEHFTILGTHMFHAAFLQYLPLDVSQLLIDDVHVRGRVAQ